MKLQHSVEAEEWTQLRAQWGNVPLEEATLTVAPPFLTGEHQMLVSDGRRAEICYIMHRGDPADGVLLHIKTFYPAGAFRLPTGGIHTGEAVAETLAREIFEETGLILGDGAEQVQVQRFLGVLAYTLSHPQLGNAPFATYHFLVRMPDQATLAPQDPAESIGGWEWRPARDLDTVADRLQQVGQESAAWADWGRFRALSHRFVAQQLA